MLSITSASGLSRIRATGGVLEPLTIPDRAAREKTHRFPDVLPGGRAVVFTVGFADLDTYSDARIVVREKSGETRTLVEGGTCARYVAPGFLVYAKAGSLWALVFDFDSLRTSGAPARVQADVSTSPVSGVADFALSRNGTLVYASGGETSVKRRLVWVDRDGKKASVVDAVAAFFSVTVPEGGKLFAQAGQANDVIYSYDLGSGARSQLTKGWDSALPSWSAEDGRLIFLSDRGGDLWRLYSMRPVAGAEADMLLDRDIYWTDDRARHGKFAVEVFDRSTNSDVWLVSLATRKGTPLLAGKDGEKFPALSPSGRLLAYVSDRTKPPEVFVVRIERPGDRVQVSSGGGSLPRWGATDAELFYTDGARILRAQVSEGPAGVALKPPEALPFDVSQYMPVSGYSIPFYNITPDGSRFILIEQLPGTAPPSALNLVTHWTTELQRKLGGR